MHPARAWLSACLVAVGVLACAGQGLAQVVANPRVAQFDPSPDHATMINGTTPVVTNYVLEVYIAGAAAPFHVMDLGKPRPAADGKLYFDFGAAAAGWPLPGGTYESRIVAVGPQGMARSLPSNPFTLVPPTTSSCPVSLSTGALSAQAVGGRATISLTTGMWCNWAVGNNAAWLTFSPMSGTGPGTIAVSVAQNPTPTSRSAKVTIGAASVALAQSAPRTPRAPLEVRVVTQAP
jgi:hypothetical protein